MLAIAFAEVPSMKPQKPPDITAAFEKVAQQMWDKAFTDLQFEAMGIPRVRTDISVSYVDHNMLQTDFRNADGRSRITANVITTPGATRLGDGSQVKIGNTTMTVRVLEEG